MAAKGNFPELRQKGKKEPEGKEECRSQWSQRPLVSVMHEPGCERAGYSTSTRRFEEVRSTRWSGVCRVKAMANHEESSGRRSLVQVYSRDTSRTPVVKSEILGWAKVSRVERTGILLHSRQVGPFLGLDALSVLLTGFTPEFLSLNQRPVIS